jgi:hypothetical protein
MCESSLYATAVHEAGHAVIGRVLGMLCGNVTIDADQDSSGHGIVAEPERIWSAWEERRRYREMSTVILGRIMTFMAGAESEVEILGSCRGGDDDDRYQIESMMLTGWRPSDSRRGSAAGYCGCGTCRSHERGAISIAEGVSLHAAVVIGRGGPRPVESERRA